MENSRKLTFLFQFDKTFFMSWKFYCEFFQLSPSNFEWNLKLYNWKFGIMNTLIFHNSLKSIGCDWMENQFLCQKFSNHIQKKNHTIQCFFLFNHMINWNRKKNPVHYCCQIICEINHISKLNLAALFSTVNSIQTNSLDASIQSSTFSEAHFICTCACYTHTQTIVKERSVLKSKLFFPIYVAKCYNNRIRIQYQISLCPFFLFQSKIVCSSLVVCSGIA